MFERSGTLACLCCVIDWRCPSMCSLLVFLQLSYMSRLASRSLDHQMGSQVLSRAFQLEFLESHDEVVVCVVVVSLHLGWCLLATSKDSVHLLKTWWWLLPSQSLVRKAGVSLNSWYADALQLMDAEFVLMLMVVGMYWIFNCLLNCSDWCKDVRSSSEHYFIAATENFSIHLSEQRYLVQIEANPFQDHFNVSKSRRQ